MRCRLSVVTVVVTIISASKPLCVWFVPGLYPIVSKVPPSVSAGLSVPNCAPFNHDWHTLVVAVRVDADINVPVAVLFPIMAAVPVPMPLLTKLVVPHHKPNGVVFILLLATSMVWIPAAARLKTETTIISAVTAMVDAIFKVCPATEYDKAGF